MGYRNRGSLPSVENVVQSYEVVLAEIGGTHRPGLRSQPSEKRKRKLEEGGTMLAQDAK
jgi:hypothetical protein